MVALSPTIFPFALISDLAVKTPTESILVTSSYVNVPPIETLPVKLALGAVIIPVNTAAPLL